MRTTAFALMMLIGPVFLLAPQGAHGDSVACAASDADAGSAIRALAGRPHKDVLNFDCRDGRLVTVSASLSPGAVAELQLVWPVQSEAPPQIVSESQEVAWLTLGTVERSPSGQVVTLQWRAPDQGEIGQRRSAHIRLGGQSLEVRLEIVSGGKLFQDGFDVDPVIGQFSMAFSP